MTFPYTIFRGIETYTNHDTGHIQTVHCPPMVNKEQVSNLCDVSRPPSNRIDRDIPLTVISAIDSFVAPAKPWSRFIKYNSVRLCIFDAQKDVANIKAVETM